MTSAGHTPHAMPHAMPYAMPTAPRETPSETPRPVAPLEARAAAYADTRRVTELDADFQRLHAATVRALTASVRTLVRGLRSPSVIERERAISAFLARHVDLLRRAYLSAHVAGQRDYWETMTLRPRAGWTRPSPPAEDVVRERLTFYAPSVARMAHEAQLAHQQSVIGAALSESITLADKDALRQWEEGVQPRITLQADLTWSGLQDGYVAAGGSDPANPFRFLWWDLEPGAQHCDDCILLAATSPYTRPGSGGNELWRTPGDGTTACGAACKCALRYGTGDFPSPDPLYDWAQFFPRALLDEADVAPVVSGGTSAGQSGGSENGAGEASTADGDTADTEMRRALRVKRPPTEEMTEAELRALDLWRATVNAWNEWRGELPELPEMFATEAEVAAGQALSAWDWETLTPKQRSLLRQALEAIGMLLEAFVAADAEHQGRGR